MGFRRNVPFADVLAYVTAEIAIVEGVGYADDVSFAILAARLGV
jgi:hypothetical protein